MQLISWLMLGPLHQSDRRQTDALGLVCDEPGPLSPSATSHFVSAVFPFSTHLVFCPCFIVLSSLRSSKHLVRVKAEHSHWWKMVSST